MLSKGQFLVFPAKDEVKPHHFAELWVRLEKSQSRRPSLLQNTAPTLSMCQAPENGSERIFSQILPLEARPFSIVVFTQWHLESKLFRYSECSHPFVPESTDHNTWHGADTQEIIISIGQMLSKYSVTKKINVKWISKLTTKQTFLPGVFLPYGQLLDTIGHASKSDTSSATLWVSGYTLRSAASPVCCASRWSIKLTGLSLWVKWEKSTLAFITFECSRHPYVLNLV